MTSGAGSMRLKIKKLAATAMIRGFSLAPEAILQKAAGPKESVAGRTLDPQVQLLLRASKLFGGTKFYDRSPEEARRFFREQTLLIQGPPLAMSSIQDLQIPTDAGLLQARMYIPFQSGFAMPALVYFHGGGFFVGDLDTHDDICRFLALHASCAVISVAYRLAPEHPAPAATDDGIAAFRWVAAHAASLHLQADKIAVGGDSAGGNLSAVVCQATREDAVRPAFQLLIYPRLDATHDFPSYHTFKDDPIIDHETIAIFNKHYFQNGFDRSDLRASPLRAPDLQGLPPAYLALAGFDPLLDEGLAYAQRLQEAAVPTTARCFDSLPHGFLTFSAVSKAAASAITEIAAALRKALRS